MASLTLNAADVIALPSCTDTPKRDDLLLKVANRCGQHYYHATPLIEEAHARRIDH